MLVVALLQGRGEPVEGDSEINRCLVYAGDRDGTTLPGLGAMNNIHENLHQ
jgi:hypothetical protein